MTVSISQLIDRYQERLERRGPRLREFLNGSGPGFLIGRWQLFLHDASRIEGASVCKTKQNKENNDADIFHFKPTSRGEKWRCSIN